MVLAAVVEHVVDIDLYVMFMSGTHQSPEVLQRAVIRIHVRIVLHVIAVIGCRRVNGREPQGRRSERVEVVQLVDDTLEIPDTVSIRVRKRIHQQLVGNLRILRPVPFYRVRSQQTASFLLFSSRSLGIAGVQRRSQQQGQCQIKCLLHNGYCTILKRAGTISVPPSIKIFCYSAAVRVRVSLATS